MLFRFVSLILAIQKSSFLSISQKKQLALGVPMHEEGIRPLADWVVAKDDRPSGASGKASSGPMTFCGDQMEVCEGMAHHGATCSMPLNSSVDCLSIPRRGSPFLSAFDNPDILKKFKNDCANRQKTFVLTSNPINGAGLMCGSKKGGGRPALDEHKRDAELPKDRSLGRAATRLHLENGTMPFQGRKATSSRLSRPKLVNTINRVLTKTMTRSVKTVTKSVMVPLYQSPVTSTLLHPVVSVVTKSVTVPVLQHSTVTMSVPHYIMLARQAKRHVPRRVPQYPVTSTLRPRLAHNILGTPVSPKSQTVTVTRILGAPAPPASNPQVVPVENVTVTRYLASQNPVPHHIDERNLGQLPRVVTVTRYLETIPEGSRDPVRPFKTVTIFRSHGDQTITLDLREKKTSGQAPAANPAGLLATNAKCSSSSVAHPVTTVGAPNFLSSELIGSGSKAMPPLSKNSIATVVVQPQAAKISTAAPDSVTQVPVLDAKKLVAHASSVTVPGGVLARKDLESGHGFDLYSLYGKSPEGVAKNAFDEDELDKLLRTRALDGLKIPQSTVILLRSRNEKLTVTVTNISTVTITKNRESVLPGPSVTYKTLTVSDTKQLNDRLQELENSFRSGTENYLTLISRVIKMLEDGRGSTSVYPQSISSSSQLLAKDWRDGMEVASRSRKSDCSPAAVVSQSSAIQLSKDENTFVEASHSYGSDSVERYPRMSSIGAYTLNSTEVSWKFPPKTTDLDTVLGKARKERSAGVVVESSDGCTTCSSKGDHNARNPSPGHIPRPKISTLPSNASTRLSMPIPDKTQKASTNAVSSDMHTSLPGHKELRNPLLEILDLVSGSGGKSNLVDEKTEGGKKGRSTTQSMHFLPRDTVKSKGRQSPIQAKVSNTDSSSRHISSSKVLGPLLEEDSEERSERSLSLKNELLKELLKFINKNSRSEEDILKILDLIRLVKDERPPDSSTRSPEMDRELDLPVAKTVTIISNEGSYKEDSRIRDASTGVNTSSAIPTSSSDTQAAESHSNRIAKPRVSTQDATTLPVLRTETMIKDHIVTVSSVIPQLKTVTVSSVISQLKTVTVKQTITQHHTITYHPPVVQHVAIIPSSPKIASTTAAAQVKSIVLPKDSTVSASDLPKNLYVLSPIELPGIEHNGLPSPKNTGHDGIIELGDNDKVVRSDGSSKVIELGGNRNPTEKGSPKERKARKRRIRSAEITLENLSGSSPRIIDISLPIDKFRDMLEKIDQD